MQRWLVLVMFLLGLAGMAWAGQAGGDPRIESALSGNQSLLAMLVAVSFLRLITQPVVDPEESLPHGRRALWRTLFGVHLFGAVINLSAVAIIGDRLSTKRPLTLLQALVLSRGFAMAAHWSPFFAAMGVALTNAPGARLATLSIIGLPLALTALLLSGWRLGRRSHTRGYAGYPMHFGALWIPSLLALAVMLVHQHSPETPILSLISLLSLGLSSAFVLLRWKDHGVQLLSAHITRGLPRMAEELSLFLAAAVLSAGIAAVVKVTGLAPGIIHFGASQASLLLLMLCLDPLTLHIYANVVA